MWAVRRDGAFRVRREESETSDEERPAKRKRAVTLEKEADARGGFRRRATRKGKEEEVPKKKWRTSRKLRWRRRCRRGSGGL